MLKTDVINYFGKLENVAKALSISVSAISQWNEIIPEKNAYKLQDITKGKLKVNRDLYQKPQN
ncbi:TPA: Cro/Cl family transcriptional regulator [Pasteurella multocida]|uniref:Cro/CI family transcriptional regulator n=1 Tax=Pasteurella multocida TaxID=747 RepID=UPI002947FF36|nr:Cro/CI family transcriptional regulator [Pasteurella multocida]MEB3501804.1 Cro/CI family transcriptional regulator [Pasteurella multocida]HDR1113661.1 Cro/Cl family transcriptional regulator [Pasteurella multocida]HDR1116860.1 Cro/Cl family transcriptional regulator [Pasteurella multocida]HDR1345453.1 Cro/Cl family transcriptional regulator [Pasteurella multocida]HDR1816929.1 Cro/Cl family transcriptional regulator [Pasteurella multocida]